MTPTTEAPHSDAQDTLKPFGFLPGFYTNICRDCPDGEAGHFQGAKRSWRCWEHAMAAKAVHEGKTATEAPDLVERVAELQLAAFLAGRGSIRTKADGRTVEALPGPTMDDYRRMALAAIPAPGVQDALQSMLEDEMRTLIDVQRVQLAAKDAEIERLKSQPQNTAEMPEVAAMRYIEQLRSGIGASVTILCDNDDATYKEQSVAIEACADWTDWENRRFYGESVLQCLAKAVTARANALRASTG